MAWGWNAENPGSTKPTKVETNLLSTNWEYSVTTGDNAALNPNTRCTFGFSNYCNLGSGTGGLNSNAFANFDQDWNMAKGGLDPEPSSWAPLIAGFGLVGTSMRRRRRTLA